MKKVMQRIATGFLSLFVLALVAAPLASLTGCAGVSQAVQAYGTVAVSNARAANDTIIEAQKVALCALPLSAITRHPELVPAIKSLCLAPSDTSTAALLDAAATASIKPATPAGTP